MSRSRSKRVPDPGPRGEGGGNECLGDVLGAGRGTIGPSQTTGSGVMKRAVRTGGGLVA